MITLQQVTSIARAVEPFEFEYFGGAIVAIGAVEVPIETLSRWTPSGGTARFHDPTFRLDALTMPIAPNTIAPEDRRITLTGFLYDDDSDWTMVDGIWTSKQTRTNRKRGNRDDFEVEFERFTWSRAGEPAWQVIVVQGFNHAIFGKPALGEVCGFDFEAFNRDVALVALDLLDAFGSPYAALVFRGEAALTEDQLESALSLLSFISGRMVRIACTAQHGFDGSAVSRTLYKHDSYPRRALPPFRLSYPRDGVGYLQREFGSMLDALVASRTQPAVEIDVAITHLLAEAAFVDTEIRDMTIALDTLIESEAFKPGSVEPFLPKQEFKTCAKPLLEALSRVISPKALERARSIFSGLNDPTHGMQREKFWRSVGFSPSAKERDALQHRHTMSHRGFLSSAKGDNDGELQLLHEDAAILRTLVNRCVFSLLGWRHPVQNYNTFFDEPMPTRPQDVGSK